MWIQIMSFYKQCSCRFLSSEMFWCILVIWSQCFMATQSSHLQGSNNPKIFSGRFWVLTMRTLLCLRMLVSDYQLVLHLIADEQNAHKCGQMEISDIPFLHSCVFILWYCIDYFGYVRLCEYVFARVCMSACSCVCVCGCVWVCVCGCVCVKCICV
jgi:hypothetical protein